MVNHGKRETLAQLERLRRRLLSLRDERGAARGHVQNQTSQQLLLLGMEMLLKIEEQVLLPALRAGGHDTHSTCTETRRLGDELTLLRDVALLVTIVDTGRREDLMKVLAGLATLHFERLRELESAASEQDIEWSKIHDEVHALLARWHREVAEHGEIEDEDRDPVGLAPR